MNAYQWERLIYRALSERYDEPAPSGYEIRARQSYARSAKRMSKATLLSKIARSQLIAFGDDRLVPQDGDMSVELCQKSFRSPSQLALLTDRPIATREVDPILHWARERRISIFHSKYARSLERSDSTLVEKAKMLLERGYRVIIWTGALRVSPVHLPALFRGFGDSLFLSLESSETRWRNRRSEGWGEITSNVAVYFGRSPLLSLEYHRAIRTETSFLLRPEELESQFTKAVQEICLRVKEKPPVSPRFIFTPFDFSTLESLAENRFTRETTRFLRERLVRGESAVLPALRLVLISTLDAGHLGEEAGHYVRLAKRPEVESTPFVTIIEEAFAYLASLWIDPLREIPVLKKQKLTHWEKCHQLGYQLGSLLERQWKRSHRARERIRGLWKIRPRTEKEAQYLFNELRLII